MSTKYRTGSRYASRFVGSNGVAARRSVGLNTSRANRSKLVSERRYSIKKSKYGPGFSKRRKTYKKIKVSPVLRRAVKMIENEDKEMKFTSVVHLDADIRANTTGSWSRITDNTSIPSDYGEDINIAVKTVYSNSDSTQKVVTGDSIVLQREGSEIYTKRLDFVFDVAFDGSAQSLKVPYAYVRLWVVQGKAMAATVTPSFSLWQVESKSGEVWQAYSSKSMQFFDPRSTTNSTEKNQFKVLKKMLIKVNNPYINYVNAPVGFTTAGTPSSSNPIVTALGYSSIAAHKQFLRSIYLGKNCQSTKFAGDTNGDPSMGNIWVMVQAWSPFINEIETAALSIHMRACYKEDPSC